MSLSEPARIVDLIRSHRSTDDLLCLYGADGDGGRRRRNLERYLETVMRQRPHVALIGEAPGHHGSVRTGVPFLSEAQAVDPASSFRSLYDFEVEIDPSALERPSDEATSNVMWRTLAEVGARPLLWSACSRHPHRPGEPRSNRTPARSEVLEHRAELEELLSWARVQYVVAVGGVASRALAVLGIPHRRVRHPARGGAKRFRDALVQFFDEVSDGVM